MKQRKSRVFFRIVIGWITYTLLRYVQWALKAATFCKKPGTTFPDGFDYCISRHQSLLFRNLKNTEKWMDGIVLEPGKTLSFWRRIGAPIAWRGFKKGAVIVNGRVQIKTGGGLCQLSNLLYWITLHTPLTVTERFRHSYDVFPDRNRTQPFGSGATCLYNYRDLQIRNEYIEPFQLRLSLDDTYLYGEWRARQPATVRYEVYEHKHWITQEGSLYVRNNILMRRCFRGNTLLDNEYITENHALMMYSPLLAAPKSFAENKQPEHHAS